MAESIFFQQTHDIYVARDLCCSERCAQLCPCSVFVSVFSTFLREGQVHYPSFVSFETAPCAACMRTLDKTQPPKELQSFPSPSLPPWLPDGYSQIFRSGVFGPSGFWTMAPLRYAAKFDPFLSLDCAPHPPPWHNPRKGRDQILPSGNLASLSQILSPW